jgi:signal transduction histidine kinase
MRPTVAAGAWIWAGWTALALLLGVSTALTYRSTGRAANWSFNVARALVEWWLWAALTPLVVRLARRWPVHGPHWVRALAAHGAVGALVALGKTHADRALVTLVIGFRPYFLVSTLALQFVVYAGIVAAAHGLEYYRRSREREQLERRLADTRLQLLHTQLQPHFLFNTLNTIAELVHENPAAADRMVTSLAELLRRSLALGGTQQITLDAELDLLGTYLDIQKARFGERLAVQLSVADDARAALVPVLLLQPIVENALKNTHAARLDGRVEAGRLTLEVTDEGPGVDAEALQGRAGIGLGNTRERLSALYGPAASLELANAPSGGARVTIRLPYRRGASA